MSSLKGKEAAKNQARISSFFPQSPKKITRGRSPVDLTQENDEPLPKRRKTTSSFFPNTAAAAGRVTQQVPTARHETVPTSLYRYDPAVHEHPPATRDKEKQAARKQREERLKHLLLADDNVFARKQRGEEDEAPEEEDGEDVQDEEEESHLARNATEKFKELMGDYTNPGARTKKAGKRKAGTQVREEIGPSGQAYTAMELQVRDFKRDNPGTILMFDVGYKCYFFGEDAQIASKLLGVVCFQKRNFLNAMIPVHRKEVHLKKLLSQGYKVGIVEQTETAALKKASKNKSGLFARKLTHLYTAATYVDQLNSVDETEPTAMPPLVCVIEQAAGGQGINERVLISMISISASTGDVVWDQFEDNHMRTELETRMVHITPSELLLPESGLSESTDKMLAYLTAHTHVDFKIRTERFKTTMSYTEAFDLLSKFYTDKSGTATASQSVKSGELVAAVANFPKQVVIALAHAVKYLSTFDVADALLETQFFKKFTERTHMLLNGNTLTNLEIYRNETDYSKKGSLLWILDSTTTRFGARMLRDWIGRPLVDKEALNARVDAVEEILSTQSGKLTILRQLLRGLPDLARGLCRIQYGKCTPQELAVLLTSFSKIGKAFDLVDRPDQAGFRSPILNDVLFTLPKLREPIEELLMAIDTKAAKEGKKEILWTDEDRFPEILGLRVVTESELVDELRKVRKQLGRPALQYSDVAGEEYLIELKKSEVKEVPPTWKLISGTKYIRRLRTPEMTEKLEKRAQYKEALEAEANRAYSLFLQEISQNYYGLLRDTVNKLAIADCLLSLALRALQDGYVRPQFADEDVLQISEGRHPMIEALRDSPFVPNSIRMNPRHKVITGPNMGGKSSVVRMIALCAIMAQIGSYVPAESMKLGMLDGILIRMGASDELARGRSTFMVELQETNDILRLATPRTLVILDELGRGTSTFDGMAIASAVLQELVQKTRCKTLFITHYPEIALELERKFPSAVENVHMGYMEEQRINGTREVTFLYKLTAGITTNSFGIECARLAGLPESILRKASTEAETMRSLIEQRGKRNRLRKCLRLMQNTLRRSPSDTQASSSLAELRALAASITL
ncbi:hypothetical protein NM688_g6551 [Phlebia brevispora]|uniref:Uncharacterized protein n=1 Tax=Phlebia brevispora TaxID=194682 RepID=A0ACC1SEQ4_9APHY|nr:hypothetical protein NM688_g6551 [Phlebia brevispora]